MVRDSRGLLFRGPTPGLDVEIVSRRSPTTIRFGTAAKVIRLQPDHKVVVRGGRARRPLAAPGPGEGGPPDVTMRSPRELTAASPETLLRGARGRNVRIRVKDVEDFDVHSVRSLAREATKQGLRVTLELD